MVNYTGFLSRFNEFMVPLYNITSKHRRIRSSVRLKEFGKGDSCRTPEHSLGS